MAAALTILAVIVMILAAACWAADNAREAEVAQIHRDIAALQAANEATRPEPPTVDILYPENGPAYNARD